MYLNELFEIAKVHHHPRDRVNLTTTTDAHLPFNFATSGNEADPTIITVCVAT